MSVIKTLYYFQIFEFGKIKKKDLKKFDGDIDGELVKKWRNYGLLSKIEIDCTWNTLVLYGVRERQKDNRWGNNMRKTCSIPGCSAWTLEFSYTATPACRLFRSPIFSPRLQVSWIGPISNFVIFCLPSGSKKSPLWLWAPRMELNQWKKRKKNLLSALKPSMR